MMASADHGDTVTFHCESMGGPNNMYFWVRNASEEVCLDCAGVTDIESFLEGENYIVVTKYEADYYFFKFHY